ncbi:MAG: hypothetical protein UR51_C0022G0028 [Candidatus Moranbacteria bacterium GW2011_GWF1_34_10]|nr:MAG: hypothetical protein UR51_C0022G0028 [Candidatus Moranbacteria bacterium GW2011_GWF1_34_10]
MYLGVTNHIFPKQNNNFRDKLNVSSLRGGNNEAISNGKTKTQK